MSQSGRPHFNGNIFYSLWKIMLEFGVVNCVVWYRSCKMRCSNRIPSKLKHLFFFICSFCQVQDQSVGKGCAAPSCQKRMMCLPIDHRAAESSGMSILGGREPLGFEKLIKCTPNWSSHLEELCSSLETGCQLIFLLESLLIFSSYPKITQLPFPFPPSH